MNNACQAAIGLAHLRATAGRVAGPDFVGAVLRIQHGDLELSHTGTVGSMLRSFGLGRVAGIAEDQAAVAQAQASVDAMQGSINALRSTIAAIGVDENGKATDPDNQGSVDQLLIQIGSAKANLAIAQQALANAQAQLAADQAQPSGPKPQQQTAPRPAPIPDAPPIAQPLPAKKTAWWKWALGGVATAAAVVAAKPNILHGGRK